ncbi:hypothetical protein B0I37DRAFT_405877 [Chaetomium sp. MPI-CAGE-AT-0009]|nr:hypothetical protein B0I37DRAFT_405877 [Chaetomium sp. MPI-CAGE-AT-0009]
MSRLLPVRYTLRRTLRTTTTPRTPTPTPSRLASSFLQTGPSPPRLPADQQAEFERLQRAAEAALSSHTTIPSASATTDPDAAPLTTSRHVSTPSGNNNTTNSSATATATAAGLEGGELGGPGPGAGSFSGGMRKGAPPEFEGDKNPATGEVGGPKNEPLRWGGEGDWSFNGRVTDF